RRGQQIYARKNRPPRRHRPLLQEVQEWRSSYLSAPPEILGVIFKEVRRLVEDQTFPYQSIGRDHVWWIRAVSHVCSHWRNVALHLPGLWTNIPLGNPTWAKEMVVRSKSAILTINHNPFSYVTPFGPSRAYSASSFSLFKEILKNHMSRLGTLSVDSVHDDLCPLLDVPAPNLQSLKFVMPQSITLTLPPKILQTSQLQSLILDRCGMNWDPQLSHLQHLRVLVIRNLPGILAPTMMQLLAILETTPHLTEITFEPLSRQSQSLGVNNGAAKPIKLNHLRKISIANDFSSCALFLDNVSFPRTASELKFTVQFSDWEDHVDLSGIEQMARNLDASIERPLTRVVMGNDFVSGWINENFPNHDGDTVTAFLRYSQPTVSMRFIGINSRATSHAIGKTICRSFNMNQVSALQVTTDVDEDTWSFFSRLPHLKELEVAKDALGFHAALRGPDGNTTVAPTFPALWDLTLSGCDLGVTVQAGSLIGIVEAFATSFERRKDAGLKLGTFHIESCMGVDQDELGSLGEVVDLDWDETGDIDSDPLADDDYNYDP
ncbi:hypothetical protein H0H93_011039, partial [Arthromyces matolae]